MMIVPPQNLSPDLANRYEDLGILLGLDNIRSRVAQAVKNVWVPFWVSLPLNQQHPRTFQANPDIILHMLHVLGSELVAKRHALREALDEAVRDLLESYHRAAESFREWADVATSVHVFNTAAHQHAGETRDMLAEFGSGVFASTVPPYRNSFGDGLEWKVTLVFTGKHEVKISRFFTHHDVVQYFGDLPVVRESRDSHPQCTANPALRDCVRAQDSVAVGNCLGYFRSPAPQWFTGMVDRIWNPFWDSVPSHLNNMRTLLSDEELVVSLLEYVASVMVSDCTAMEASLVAADNGPDLFIRQDLAQWGEMSGVADAAYRLLHAESDSDEDDSGVFASDADVWKLTLVFGERKLSRYIDARILEELPALKAFCETEEDHDPEPTVDPRLTGESGDNHPENDQDDYDFPR